MTKFTLLALVWIVLDVTAALASDTPTASITVDGTSYGVYVRAGAATVVEAPARATLVRDSSHRNPACQDVERNLSRLTAQIESCKPPNDASDICVFVRTLVDQVRFDPGTIGSSELEQHWNVNPRVSTPRNREAVVAAAASATGLAPSAVRFVAQAQTVAGPTSGRVIVAASGRSWASKLLGLVEFAAPTLTASGRWITRDHVLACGIQAGDVSIAWDQRASLASSDAVLTEDELWSVYQQLQSGTFPGAMGTVSQQTLGIGAAIGKALGTLAVAQDSARFAAAIDLVFSAFFDASTLAFADHLSEAEVRAIVHATALEYNLAWLGTR